MLSRNFTTGNAVLPCVGVALRRPSETRKDILGKSGRAVAVS